MKTQRRYERVGFFCELTVTSIPGGEAAPARSLDISVGGVGMFAGVSWGRGDLVRIGFHLKDAQQRPVVEQVLGRVAYSRADEDGNMLGVEFLEPIREAMHPVLARKLQTL